MSFISPPRRPALRTLLLATIAALGAAAIVPAATASASALLHLRLVKSEPAAGDTVAAPATLRLWFSEPATVSVTSLRLTGTDGKAVTLAKPTFGGDAKLPVEAKVTGAVAPGRYTVSFKTASRDMHPISGDFSFTVR